MRGTIVRVVWSWTHIDEGTKAFWTPKDLNSRFRPCPPIRRFVQHSRGVGGCGDAHFQLMVGPPHTKMGAP